MSEGRTPSNKPKGLSMGDVMNDPKLQPPKRHRPYYDRDPDLDGFHGTGMTEEDILGYTPGDQD